MSTEANPVAAAAAAVARYEEGDAAEPATPTTPGDAAGAASATAADAAAAGVPKISAKEARKAAKLAEEQAKAKEKAESLMQFAETFGNSPILQSTTYQSRRYFPIEKLDACVYHGSLLVLRGRLAQTRKKGKLAFIVLRAPASSTATVQAMAAVTEGGENPIPKEMIDFIAQVPLESIVDVEAIVERVDKPITGASISDLELKIVRFHVVSESQRVLPFQLEDASRGEAAEGIKVGLDTRLNTRWLDLRTPACNSIFRLQSRVAQYFRSFLIDLEFVEIHSPKIIAAASEGGANVFKLGYFGKDAFLAQSPQLYKQMAVQGDLPRVFEVGPVFRAENSNTHRHLTEFVGLDLEMAINEHYFEVLNLAEELFGYIFTELGSSKECAPLIAAVKTQYPFEDFEHQLTYDTINSLGVGIIEDCMDGTDVYGARIRNLELRMLRIPYAGAVALLNSSFGPEETPLSEVDDINTANEKRLGVLIKKRYGVDFFISDRFPSVARPFYTMPCPDDARFTNSYDMFIRGEEISSGAQRIHDPEMLVARMRALGLPPSAEHQLKDYINSFRLGALPHGGFGVGLERVVMLYLALGNVRLASLFPRDPARCEP